MGPRETLRQFTLCSYWSSRLVMAWKNATDVIVAENEGSLQGWIRNRYRWDASKKIECSAHPAHVA